MFKPDDRVRETSTTIGVGTYTLAGAPAGFQAFSSLGANNYCPYFATDDVNWETGIGQVLTAPDRLARTTIFASSNADAAVNWGATTKKIRCGLPALMAYPRALSKDVGGVAGTTILTQEEMRRSILIFTGALTGNRTIEVDDTPWQWAAVINNTTGNFTLTMKVAGQPGAEFYQGRAAPAVNGGVDVKKGGDDLPPGTFEDYGGGTVQPGRLLCDGANVSRATYSALFNKVGTTWGAGDGSTTFGLPDFRRRVAVGSGGTGTAQLGNAVGNTGGAESRAIAQLNLPATGLSVPALSIPSLTVNFSDAINKNVTGGTGPYHLQGSAGIEAANPVTASTSASNTGTGTTGNMGSGSAFDEMQPGAVVLKTIRT